MNDIGTWELDIETGETYWSEEVYNIHEVPKDFDHNKANGIDFFHPDDRSRISKALENTIEHGEPFEVTARFITAKDNL
ncbi:PAS domain-containing protein [Gracilimonas halophila]|uniref:PAS domain-containing protein n=1 Tax=Gracilimonas halophila TaxID=1834464 RepID=A0ABW5JKK1_9BACT